MPTALIFLICIMGGIATVFQSQFMGLIEKRLGLLEAVFITYGGGALVIGLIMLFAQGGKLGHWRSLPLYALSTGVLGLILIAALSLSVPRVGLVMTFTIFVATQFILGGIIDHFGLFGAEVRSLTGLRLLGVITLLLGVWLIVRK
ncbi:MAG: DMT family transporter [Deinococcales bacterium]